MTDAEHQRLAKENPNAHRAVGPGKERTDRFGNRLFYTTVYACSCGVGGVVDYVTQRVVDIREL